MKYFIILIFFSPAIIIATFLVGSYYSRLKKTKNLLGKYGVEVSVGEKFDLDRDIFNSNYIRLWPRHCVGISVKNLIRLDSKRVLGCVLFKYGDRRNSLMESEVVTVLCVQNDNKDIMPDTSLTVVGNSSIQVWPFKDKVIVIGGFIDNEKELNLFISKSEAILSAK